jgi:NADH-quinone oxidoreductase subunit M
VMFGKVNNPANRALKDLTHLELATLLPLVLLAFWIGIYPKPFLSLIEKPVEKVVRIVNPGYFSRMP